MKLLVIGRPGAGKGTQSRRVAEILGVPHISTGDLLRDAISEGTPLGLRTNASVSAGRLVPDSLVGAMLETRLGRPDVRHCGWLLDGFPRTPDQLEALERWLAPDRLDAAVELVVPPEVAVARLLARGREDDTAAAIRQRLDAYERETQPVLQLLADEGLLVSVDGDRPVDEVTAAVLEAIGKAGAR
jgi:adenylate kinase